MAIFGQIKTPPSLKEMAFQAIKNAILSNRLEPGKIYSEFGLATELGISKTPVREALANLAAQGFVTVLARKGIRINSLTAKDIRDLYEFRAAIETAIIRHITPELTEQSIRRLESILQRQEAAIKEDNWMKYLRIDREFHLFLASLTQNEYMISALEGIRDLIDWTGSKALLRKERIIEVKEEHNRILHMLKKRDVKSAVRMMGEHIRITQEKVLENI